MAPFPTVLYPITPLEVVLRDSYQKSICHGAFTLPSLSSAPTHSNARVLDGKVFLVYSTVSSLQSMHFVSLDSHGWMMVLWCLVLFCWFVYIWLERQHGAPCKTNHTYNDGMAEC